MSVTSDIRFALRLLARSPVFTASAVLSLAIGIAASATIFSLADAMLLRPRVGVTNPETLVDIGRTTRGEGSDNFGYPLFRAMTERATMFDGLAAQRIFVDVMALGDGKSSERVFASLVSGNYFALVGTRPAAGRFFLPDEDRTPGAHPVVVLTHQFWTRRFQANAAIIGETIRLNNLPYVVVGVAEPGFTGTTILGTDFWVPMAMDAHVRASAQSLLESHDSVWMMALGRLKPGISPEQARSELNAVMRNYFSERGDTNRLEHWGIAVTRSSRIPVEMAGPVLGFIGVLGTLTGLVLLIACSNVAAMLLARALERRREVATRLAVGATRGRILVQLLLEGLILALIAGALSVPVAQALMALLSSFQPSLPVPVALALQMDPRVLMFAFGLAALTSVLFALIPALQATRFELAPALHGHNSTIDRRRAWLRHVLVTAQVAMALLLLVVAGLFLRSLQEAATTDAGLSVENVDIVQIDTRIGGYLSDAEGVRTIDALTERFRLVPSVVAVGVSRMVPLQGGGLGMGGLRAPGFSGPDGTDAVDTDWDVVSPGYFDALEVRILQGRAFTARDRDGAPRVAIINEFMAAHLWPEQNPIGKQLIQEMRDNTEQSLEIVGIARNAKHRSIGEPQRNFIYVPLAQQYLADLTFYVKRSTPDSKIVELRNAVTAFNPNLPVINAQTLEVATSLGLFPQRLAAWIAGSVGITGLLLASLGLYGLTAFSVAQRTREIAVRMALGATRDVVLSLVLRQAGALAVAGTVIGLALSVALGALLESLLVGIGSIDPVAFAAATVLLSAVLIAATWTPARRAAKMDPMRALRAE